MFLYIGIILLGNILIVLGNLLCVGSFSGWLYACGCSVMATILVIAVDGLTAFLVRRLPEKWFQPGGRLYAVSQGERKFYRCLGVKCWKDKVPELGVFTGFHKSHLTAPKDADYLGRFLLESNYGVVIHWVNALFGFLILAIPGLGGISYTLPVALVNFALSLMPAMILRYNTPGLFRLYQRAKK
ncbi:MAG: hypothetical protein IKU26_07440 [Clostridia bacterium]|nr:hypothetical protein [Clostridia bacterium]